MPPISQQTPPFFKQGTAPVIRLAFFVALSMSLIVVDLRLHYLELLRQAIALATFPLQRLAYGPVAAAGGVGNYFTNVARLQKENASLVKKALANDIVGLRQEQLDRENLQLRELLDMKQRVPVQGQAAEILFNARSPFSRKVFINKGSQQGIIAGSAVADQAGVVGQVTRVYPLQSEVTLTTNKDQGVPAQIVRNGLRAVVFGTGDGLMELRFISPSADIKEGDVLETSGLDDVYVSGLPVARVVSVRRDPGYSFASVVCVPLAGVEKSNFVLVLAPKAARPPLPEAAAGDKDAPGGSSPGNGKPRKPH